MKPWIIAISIALLMGGCAMLEEMTGIQGVKEMDVEGRKMMCKDDPSNPESELCTFTNPDGNSVTIQRKKK